MITIDIWKLHISDEWQVSIQEGDSALDMKKLYFRDMNYENKEQLTKFIRELRNYFGFKLTGDD
jgi:hypothetical protein